MVSHRTEYYLHTLPCSEKFSFPKILVLRHGFSRNSANHFRQDLAMTSFCFFLLPVEYDVLYYSFSQDLFKTGQISDQHEKVDNQYITY
jgi:hypothetical protein